MKEILHTVYEHLVPVTNRSFAGALNPMLAEKESMIASFGNGEIGVLMTERRVLVVQGDEEDSARTVYLSVPFTKVIAFQVETPGENAGKSAFSLYMDLFGKVTFSFDGNVDIQAIGRMLARYVIDQKG